LLDRVLSYIIPYSGKALTLWAKGMSGDEESEGNYWDEEPEGLFRIV